LKESRTEEVDADGSILFLVCNTTEQVRSKCDELKNSNDIEEILLQPAHHRINIVSSNGSSQRFTFANLQGKPGTSRIQRTTVSQTQSNPADLILLEQGRDGTNTHEEKLTYRESCLALSAVATRAVAELIAGREASSRTQTGSRSSSRTTCLC